MNHLSDRDLLVSLNQKVQTSLKNQEQLGFDLKDIFQRIETDSKLIVQIRGELNTHLETSAMKFNELKRLNEELRKASNTRFKDIEASISTDGEIVENLEKELSIERLERERFENNLKGSMKATKWFFGILSFFLTLITVIIAILQFTGT